MNQLNAHAYNKLDILVINKGHRLIVIEVSFFVLRFQKSLSSKSQPAPLNVHFDKVNLVKYSRNEVNQSNEK